MALSLVNLLQRSLVITTTAAIASVAVSVRAEAGKIALVPVCETAQDAACPEPPAEPVAPSGLEQIPLLPEPPASLSNQTVEVIKFKLPNGGGGQEWIRIEVAGNRLKMLHTTQTVAGLSRVANAVVGFFSPVPLPNFYQWSDHETTRIVFEPDACPTGAASADRAAIASGCAISGTTVLLLPAGTDIYQGRFTLEYRDGNLFRSVAFRLPAENLQSDPATLLQEHLQNFTAD